MIDEINLTGAALLGVERNKLPYHRFASYVATEDRDRWHRHFMYALKDDKALSCELALQHDNEPLLYAQLNCLRLKNDGKDFVVRVVLTDITMRNDVANKLLLERDQNQHYLDTTMALIVALESDGKIKMINRAAENLLGYAKNELLGRNWFTTCLPQPEGSDIVLPIFIRLMAGDMQSTDKFENAVLCRDGRQHTISWHNSLLTNTTGQIVGTLSSGLDITDRKQSEALLSNERERIKTILDTVGDPIFVKDNDHRFILANRSFYDMLSLDESAVIGSTLAESLSTAEMQHFLRVDRLVLDTGIPDLREEALTVRDITRNIITRKARFVEYSGERFLVGSIHDITENKKSEQALIESLHKLEEKELSKSRFFAAAGHDLRQPLAAANLFLDALKATEPTPKQDKIIQRLDQAMSTFSGLLNSLLNISKLDSGVIKPEPTPINVTEVFNLLEQSFAPMASEKQLCFKLHFPMKETLVVFSDIGLLNSVLMNIVSNAIKFTSNGAILVSARKRGREVLFQIWDTGIGISDEHLEHVFDEFYQVGNPQRDRTAGLGLGLAIAKRAITLLGSRITCRSQIGRGSVFEFCLPLDGVLKRQKQQAAIEALQGDETNLSFVQGKRFVVVEDDLLVAQALTQSLEGLGGEVECFHSAEDALRHTNIEYADCYIVDYMLGGKLNGIQFLNTLLQKFDKPIKAVLVTGDTSSTFIRDAANFDWPVLHKPVNTAKLISALGAQEACP
jgi:PAS domain S-box-containing protein